jgi:hypothetical protein
VEVQSPRVTTFECLDMRRSTRSIAGIGALPLALQTGQRSLNPIRQANCYSFSGVSFQHTQRQLHVLRPKAKAKQPPIFTACLATWSPALLLRA